ncbi:MAG: hypothetical protein CVV56_07720 [Tenericutes bacterium HGW-Tenericutes-1]|jgi:aldose 1-epimerase|nr:MAG: hypothetical protein CVV56_07720 [Tenericutes bacterium HGW-Tenericutes-1]
MNIITNNITNTIKEITIISEKNQKISLINIGASLTEWVTSSWKNIVAGYQDYHDYLKPGMYLGTNVGMNAGRIENSVIEIDGKKIILNSKHPHFLHGGDNSLAFKTFDVSIEKNSTNQVIICFSHDYSDENLPGIFRVEIRYYIIEGSIRIVYDVSSSHNSLCNLTNHTYFNLDGDFTHDLSNHELKIKASHVVLVNQDIIGKEIIDVTNSEFDFRMMKPIMPTIETIKLRGEKALGLDHYFPFDKVSTEAQITLKSKTSNKELNVFTTYPGVTIYTTNYPEKKMLKHGYTPLQHSAICLEVQFQSNAINDKRFEAGLVSPNRPYHHEIYFQLGGPTL